MSVMQIGDFKAEVNLPDGLPSRFGANGQEISQRLPPYARTRAHFVGELGDVPFDWERDSIGHSTYAVGVKSRQGMWVDFNVNNRSEHHTAVVVEVQGVNALTSLPVPKGDHVPLEQYKHSCPVHKTAFSGNRHCQECGFDWPAQNYLTSASSAPFWLDGFRVTGANGKPTGDVRQFLFTGDQERGVAANLIGEDRSFCLKFHFYRGPQKPRPAYRTRGFQPLGSATLEAAGSKGVTRGMNMAPEIGAGARIEQNVGVDSNSVDMYGPKVGTIVVYYVYDHVLQSMIGRVREQDGPLTDVPVGNLGNPHVGHTTY